MTIKNNIVASLVQAHEAHKDDWGWGDHLREVLRDHLPALQKEAACRKQAWEAWEASQGEPLPYWAPRTEEGAALFEGCCEAERFAKGVEDLLREISISYPSRPPCAGEEWTLKWGADEWARLREEKKAKWALVLGEETPSPF